MRRAVLYAFPTEAYGLTSTGGGFDASTKPVAAHCTPAGAAVFVGANCAVPVAIDDAWVYGGQAIDAAPRRSWSTTRGSSTRRHAPIRTAGRRWR